MISMIDEFYEHNRLSRESKEICHEQQMEKIDTHLDSCFIPRK